jgi:uncharacterized membrane protein
VTFVALFDETFASSITVAVSVDWITKRRGIVPMFMAIGTHYGYFFDTTNEFSLLMSEYVLQASDWMPGEAIVVRMLSLITNPERQKIRRGLFL